MVREGKGRDDQRALEMSYNTTDGENTLTVGWGSDREDLEGVNDGVQLFFHLLPSPLVGSSGQRVEFS